MQRAIKQLAVVAILGGAFCSQSARSQPANPELLRHDEAIQMDALEFIAGAVCTQAGGPSGRSLSFDTIEFLSGSGTALSSVDIGAQTDSYRLGQGWFGREAAGGLRTRWAGSAASVYFPVPAGAATLRIRAASACVAVVLQVRVNGTTLGSINVPANTAQSPYSLPLPANLPGLVTYTATAGGPISISALQWLNASGTVLSTSNTAVQAGATPQSRAVTRPPNATSFCVNFASAVTASSLTVSINESAATVIAVPDGVTRACALEPDTLERLADRKTLTNGWGDDFNARLSVRRGGSFTAISSNGDTLRAQHSGTGVGSLAIELPDLYPIAQLPYLAIRVKADRGAMYFIRPVGLDAQDQRALLWYESAVTDDRIGTGDWETLTFSLPKLVQQAGTGANRITDINLVMTSLDGQPHALEVDWLRLHRGLAPAIPEVSESNFTNHLDDDGDGLTDRDDPDRAVAGRLALFGTPRPQTLAYYHLWYGSPTGPSKSWQAWSGPGVPPGRRHDPDTFVADSPGQRDLWSRFYPLNFWDFPLYVPGTPLRYDLHGGVEQYDNLDPAFLNRQIQLAQEFGIEGFVANAGHQSYMRHYLEALVRAVESVPDPFSVTALYDFFYPINGGEFPEQPNFAKAREIHYFLELARSPRWTQFRGKPLITAPFASTLVTASNWQETVALATDPRASELDGVISSGPQLDTMNQVRFTFSAPAVRFERIDFRDANLERIGRFDFGSPEVRGLLTSGWGPDSTEPLRPGTVAQGTEASMQLFVPAGTEYIDIHAGSLSSQLNTVTMSVNDGPAVDFVATQLGNVGYFRLSAPSVPVASVGQRPFSFLLDNPAAAPLFDGFATYSEFLQGAGGVLVSDDRAVILSVRPGYDDQKIRTPGLLTPREDGAYYRRSWETALANDPDAVIITSWNEWPEATNVEPSVEFGYQYAELTLTYSMLLRGDLTLSRKPSEIDFTIRRRGPNQIRFSSAGAAQAVFRNLSALQLANYSVTFNGEAYSAGSPNASAGTLTLDLGAAAGEYVVTFHP